MKKIVVVMVLASLLVLWGCTADIVEHTLQDGTECAVLVGAYIGGITCNWPEQDGA